MTETAPVPAAKVTPRDTNTRAADRDVIMTKTVTMSKAAPPGAAPGSGATHTTPSPQATGGQGAVGSQATQPTAPSEQKTVVLCEECDEEHEATQYCRECKSNMCEFMVVAHKRQKKTKKHNLTPVNQAS